MRNFQTWLSQTIRLILSRNHRRIVFVGLDNSGKTTIINQIQAQQEGGTSPVQPTEPTVEFKVHTVEYKRWKLFITDLGGQDKLRTFWRHHYTGLQGVVFVVDSCDTERIPAARTELLALLKDNQLTGVPLLVLVNKQDCAEAKSVEEIEGLLLENKELLEGREVRFAPSSGRSGNGVFEALEWLCQNMKAV